MNKRTCGECHECCDFVAVEALNKPARTQCPLLQACDGNGCCSAYADRPSECKVYTCSWMDGDLPNGWKPNDCGLLFESGHIDWPQRINLLHGFELIPGAIERNRKLLRLFFTRPGTVAHVINHAQTSLERFGPAADIADVDRFLEMCRASGSLTMRMADADVEIKL